MKKAVFFLVLILCLTLFTACGQTEPVYTAEDVAGKIYTYEKEGFGGSFIIRIYGDGSFHYYEGLLSSYMGLGTWTVEDGILILTDRTGLDYENRFRIGDDELIFLTEGSKNFMYLTVEDGDRFFGEKMENGAVNPNSDVLASSYYAGSDGTKYLVTLNEVRTLILTNSDSKVDRVGELLEGFTHEDLTAAWGEPDSMTSGIWSYGWNVDETCAIWVVFDSDGCVSEVHLKLKD